MLRYAAGGRRVRSIPPSNRAGRRSRGASRPGFSPAYGGLQAIHFSAGGNRREVLQIDLKRLSERFILFYSGRQRNSGINNWDVMKRHIDGDGGVYKAFEGIVTAANGMREALLAGDFDMIDALLESEWANRRELSDGITTPEIEEIVQAARSLGAGAAKVCVAGGGGCVLMTVPEGRRKDIQAKLLHSGVKIIDYEIAGQGLKIN